MGTRKRKPDFLMIELLERIADERERQQIRMAEVDEIQSDLVTSSEEAILRSRELLEKTKRHH